MNSVTYKTSKFFLNSENSDSKKRSPLSNYFPPTYTYARLNMNESLTGEHE